MFLAERDDETFEKQVAIKVARPGALFRVGDATFSSGTSDHRDARTSLHRETVGWRHDIRRSYPIWCSSDVKGIPIDAWSEANRLW